MNTTEPVAVGLEGRVVLWLPKRIYAVIAQVEGTECWLRLSNGKQARAQLEELFFPGGPPAVDVDKG